MIVMRYIKMALVLYTTTFFGLVVLGNLSHPDINFLFVQHILTMDTLPLALHQRAINNPWLHNLMFYLIIFTELLAALFCAYGLKQMWFARKATPAQFQQAKTMSLVGLAVAVSLYFLGFIAIAGEWFMMWLSTQANAQPTALAFTLLFLLLLLVVAQTEG